MIRTANYRYPNTADVQEMTVFLILIVKLAINSRMNFKEEMEEKEGGGGGGGGEGGRESVSKRERERES